jgi:hypothetical protein
MFRATVLVSVVGAVLFLATAAAPVLQATDA